MYRIQITGYVQYLVGELLPETSLQDRTYGPATSQEYRSAFCDPSVLDRSFKTEEEARLAIVQSYKGVDDYGLGYTWRVVRRGSIVVTGAEAINYAERNGEPLFVFGAMGEEDWQIEFWEARELLESDPKRIYTTLDPYYISEGIAVNPAKAKMVAMGKGDQNVVLYRAPELGGADDTWWYYLERGNQTEAINEENHDPEVAAALDLGEEQLRQILDADVRELTEEERSTTGIGI
jgi:hypothetical protein